MKRNLYTTCFFATTENRPKFTVLWLISYMMFDKVKLILKRIIMHHICFSLTSTLIAIHFRLCAKNTKLR